MRLAIYLSLSVYFLYQSSLFLVADYLQHIAIEEMRSGKVQEGLEDFKLCYECAHNPGHAEILANILRKFAERAPVKYKWGIYRQCLRIGSEQVAHHPNSSRSWAILGNAQLLSGQNSQAQRSIARALELDPFGVIVR